MILGYHLIFGAYGFWLPNDPRGSWSEFVGSFALYLKAGKATKTVARHSVAGARHDRQAREEAKTVLLREPVRFTEEQRDAIAGGFGTSALKGKVMVWACAIMPDHVHFVIGRHRSEVEILANFMKGESTKALVAAKLHPFLAEIDEDGTVPHCWAQREWKVYLETPDDIRRAICYVEQNPIKDGLPSQRWDFVQPYEG